jgi:hypothetical protein
VGDQLRHRIPTVVLQPQASHTIVVSHPLLPFPPPTKSTLPLPAPAVSSLPQPAPRPTLTSPAPLEHPTIIMGNPQEEATALKNKGNEAFKRQDWAEAIDFYTKAIEAYDQDPSFYTNRAQVCRLSLVSGARTRHMLITAAGKHQGRVVRTGCPGCRPCDCARPQQCQSTN